ncbi:MAG: methyltransferase type 11, partial [Planctomycetota bacterium]
MKPGCRCVELYRHEGVRALLGDVWHPGGLGLTRELGGRLGLKPSDVVLDVASGRGAGSGHLAETFGCRV